MGTDSFMAYFGIRLRVDLNDEDTYDAVCDETDPRCVTAKSVGLDSYFVESTDGEDGFLYVGHCLGFLSLDSRKSYATLSDVEFTEIAASVRKRLVEAGFYEPPVMHFVIDPL